MDAGFGLWRTLYIECLTTRIISLRIKKQTIHLLPALQRALPKERRLSYWSHTQAGSTRKPPPARECMNVFWQLFTAEFTGRGLWLMFTKKPPETFWMVGRLLVWSRQAVMHWGLIILRPVHTTLTGGSRHFFRFGQISVLLRLSVSVGVCLRLFSPIECAESARRGKCLTSGILLSGDCPCWSACVNWPFGGTDAQNNCRLNCIDRLEFLVKVP